MNFRKIYFTNLITFCNLAYTPKTLYTMDKLLFGKKGELLAKNHLISLGYKILKTNYKASYAEVDIIAKLGKEVIFVEVKTRSHDYYGRPEEFVTRNQQNNMAFAATIYCNSIDHEGEIRFDIIAIIIKDGLTEIKHIEDAFFPGLV